MLVWLLHPDPECSSCDCLPLREFGGVFGEPSPLRIQASGCPFPTIGKHDSDVGTSPGLSLKVLVQDTDVPRVRWVMKTTSLRSLAVKHRLSEEDKILRNVSVKPRKALWKPNWGYKQDSFSCRSESDIQRESIHRPGMWILNNQNQAQNLFLSGFL